jgi:hypothetical protein
LYLPPGFGGGNLPLPRATREAFAPLHSIFSQHPFIKGEVGGFQRGYGPKGSPGQFQFFSF